MLGQKRFIPDSDELYEGETFVRYFDSPQAGENFVKRNRRKYNHFDRLEIRSVSGHFHGQAQRVSVSCLFGVISGD